MRSRPSDHAIDGPRERELRGMVMAMVKVKVNVTGQFVRVFIDRVKLRLSGTTADKAVAVGEHVISSVVRGVPGSSYSVAITAPPDSAF
jgi:hypothetical protein